MFERENSKGPSCSPKPPTTTNSVPRLPLGHPGAVQYRDRLLRPSCRWHGPAGADLCRRGWRRLAHLVRRNQRDVAPLRQCAEGRRPRARRPRRGVSVAVAGTADRASGGISFRHGVDSAVCAVRRGCAGIPAVEFRRQGDRHRRDRVGEARENPRPAAGSCEHLCHRRWRAGRRQAVLALAQGGVRRICDRRYLGRRSRPDHLHLRHHGKSQRARCMRIAWCSAICRISRCATISCPSPAI